MKIKSWSRLGRIFWTAYRFGLCELLSLCSLRFGRLKWLRYLPGQIRSYPLPERLCDALESLGPIFVKFGQLLSVRPDLLPEDYIKALSRLQDKVPPFSTTQVDEQIKASFNCSCDALFVDFNRIPVASASVAQVHHAWLRQKDGRRGQEVAIKILRPGIASIIDQDIALLYSLARVVGKGMTKTTRFHLKEIVAEFDHCLHEELDLTKEAANTSQLRRYFSDQTQLILPEVYFNLCTKEIMTMQWMHGLSVVDLKKLKRHHIDLPQLARLAMTLFFEQVFQYGFFHADMHPGNILITPKGQFIALDCGIMGTLSDFDKYAVAVNFLAFFNRDYEGVALAHQRCGWVPPETNIQAFASAIRAMCEPIFEKPLSDISFGVLLMRLFEVGRVFKINIQPQLILLQKTLVHIESLARQLDPQLDLWSVAKPFLSQWINQQIGWRALAKEFKREWPQLAKILPSLPVKFDQWLSLPCQHALHEALLRDLLHQTQRQNRLLTIALVGLWGVVSLFWFLG